MIRSFLIAFVIAIVATVPAFAALTGSRHDFNNGSSLKVNAAETRTGGQTCVYCHTPHAAAPLAGAPLWNRNVGNAYTMYDSATFNAKNAGATWDATKPGPVSLACLSCHDGSTAVGALLNVSAQPTGGSSIVLDKQGGSLGNIVGGILQAGNIANVTTNLTNSHPVGVDFAYVILNDAASGWKTKAQAETAGIKFYGSAGNQVECASCHDVHNGAAAAANTFMLRVSPNASAACLACHDK